MTSSTEDEPVESAASIAPLRSDDITLRLLLRSATRFSFKLGDSPFDFVHAEETLQRGWTVTLGDESLCRSKINRDELCFARTPYYTVEDVRLERDQAIALAIDVAEGRRVLPRGRQ